VHLSSPTQDGIQCPAFFGTVLAFPLALDLASASSENLGGAGATGDMTGMAVERSTTITPSSHIAESSVTRGSITVASATTASATVTLPTVTSATATPFTGTQAFTGSRECTLARSEALVTAEMSEAFPRADGRALAVVLMAADDARGARMTTYGTY